MMKTKRIRLLLLVTLLAALLWTSSALADGGGLPTATPTVTSSPAPTNTAVPTNTPPASTESAEELDAFLEQLEAIEEGAPTATIELNAVPVSDATSQDVSSRNWLGILLVGFTVLVVVGGLIAVLLFYQRSQSTRPPK